MCIAYYTQQPACDCIYASGVVMLCSIFTGLPANRNKNTFNPKLVTSRCQGLDLFFNGINYVSVDVEGYDLVPDGLDCPEVELGEVLGEAGLCRLCDSPGTMKFLKAKRIEHKPKAAEDVQDEAEEGAAEDAGEKAAEKSGERSGGEQADRTVGSSIGKGGVGGKTNSAREMLEKAMKGLAAKRARSSLAESTSASMGWD